MQRRSICDNNSIDNQNMRKICMLKNFPRQYCGVLKLLASGVRFPILEFQLHHFQLCDCGYIPKPLEAV